MTGDELDRQLGRIAADLVDALQAEPVPPHILDLARRLQEALEMREVPEPAPE